MWHRFLYFIYLGLLSPRHRWKRGEGRRRDGGKGERSEAGSRKGREKGKEELVFMIDVTPRSISSPPPSFLPFLAVLFLFPPFSYLLLPPLFLLTCVFLPACSHFLLIAASRLLPTHHESRVQFYQLYELAALRVALTFHGTRVRD